MNRAGQEIAYCSACSSRVRGLDFENGRAFRTLGQVFCAACCPKEDRTRTTRIRRRWFRAIGRR